MTGEEHCKVNDVYIFIYQAYSGGRLLSSNVTSFGNFEFFDYCLFGVGADDYITLDQPELSAVDKLFYKESIIHQDGCMVQPCLGSES